MEERPGESARRRALVLPLLDALGMPPAAIGGKSANLARLRAAGFPVPEARVVATEAFRTFIARPRIAETIRSTRPPAHARLRPDVLEARFHAITDAMTAEPLAEELASALDAAYADLATFECGLAARSSATLEDAPDASFSGMLSSVLGVCDRDELTEAVKYCWASAFNPRVANYALEKGIREERLEVAVLLQRIVRAERAGLVFTRDPANRYVHYVVVEATHGWGRDVASGEVTPERYAFDPSDGRVNLIRQAPSAPIAEPGPGERRLDDAEVGELARWALRAEEILGAPQDVEWAYGDGRFWILQSRPLVFSTREERVFPQVQEQTVLLRGVGASPKVGSGDVLVLDGDTLPNDLAGDVVVLGHLTNDLAVRLRNAAAVVVDEGGATSHGANILREFEVPAVISTGNATKQLCDGMVVTVDGFRGAVYEGDLSLTPEKIEDVPATRTQLYASVIVPEKATVVAGVADGVSTLRNDYFLLRSGIHPLEMIRRGQGAELETTIYQGIRRTAELFDEKPVWYKTMDAPTDEFRRLAGGENEPEEGNPLLGWRGIGRELAEPEMLQLELRAVARAVADGHGNLGVKLPFVRFLGEFRAALEAARRAGLRPGENVRVGLSVETPAVALLLGEYLEEGAEFVSVGVSDLTMCMLAVDRESSRTAAAFDPSHPAIVQVLASIAEIARAHGVFSCATGEAARDPRLLPQLVGMGYDAIGVSLAYFAEVKRAVHRIESEGVVGVR